MSGLSLVGRLLGSARSCIGLARRGTKVDRTLPGRFRSSACLGSPIGTRTQALGQGLGRCDVGPQLPFLVGQGRQQAIPPPPSRGGRP